MNSGPNFNIPTLHSKFVLIHGAHTQALLIISAKYLNPHAILSFSSMFNLCAYCLPRPNRSDNTASVILNHGFKRINNSESIN